MVDTGLLRNFSLFKDLDEEQLQKFVPYIKEKHFPPESLVCSQGDKGDEIFFVKEGKAAVVLPLHRFDSKYKTVSEIAKGNFFGELSFFDGEERSAYVQANGDLELLTLSRRDFDKVIKDNIKEGCRIQSKIISGLVGIIREMNETYSSAGFLL